MDKLDQEMTHKLIENALSGLEKGEISPAAAFLAVCFAGMTCPCPEADYHMSRFLFEGIGCPKNAEEGMEMLRRSVDGGWPAAQTELGRRYFEGEGVEQNYAEAVKWFLLAAEQGDKKALDWLGKILEAERSYYGFDMSEDESWPLDADTDQALEILDENDICVESGKYESYDPNNKGCNIDDPIVITRTEGYVPLEYLVIEFLVSPREMMPVKQALMKDEGRSIDIITVDVSGQEQEYYFDVTAGLKAKEELL